MSKTFWKCSTWASWFSCWCRQHGRCPPHRSHSCRTPGPPPSPAWARQHAQKCPLKNNKKIEVKKCSTNLYNTGTQQFDQKKRCILKSIVISEKFIYYNVIVTLKKYLSPFRRDVDPHSFFADPDPDVFLYADPIRIQLHSTMPIRIQLNPNQYRRRHMLPTLFAI